MSNPLCWSDHIRPAFPRLYPILKHFQPTFNSKRVIWVDLPPWAIPCAGPTIFGQCFRTCTRSSTTFNPHSVQIEQSEWIHTHDQAHALISYWIEQRSLVPPGLATSKILCRSSCLAKHRPPFTNPFGTTHRCPHSFISLPLLQNQLFHGCATPLESVQTPSERVSSPARCCRDPLPWPGPCIPVTSPGWRPSHSKPHVHGP